MADRPPTGFLEVLDADQKTDQQCYNIIGICTDYNGPSESRGTDLVMRLQLWDNSCLRSPELAEDMVVRCFHPSHEAFPPIQQVGDIVIARNLKTLSKGGFRFGVTTRTTAWTVISGAGLLHNKDPLFGDVEVRYPPQRLQKERPHPESAVFQYAKALIEAKGLSACHGPPKTITSDATVVVAEGAGRPSPMRKKFRLVRDILSPHESSQSQFVDLVGEVRRIWAGAGNPVDIYMTDYTEHPLLFDYSVTEHSSMQREADAGSWGKMIMTISAWDKHGQYIVDLVRQNKIELGMYIRVTNVHIKMDSLGTKLQGHLRGGGSNTGTTFTILNAKDAEHNAELRDLITRKRAYNIDRKSKAMGFPQEVPSKKRPHEDEPQIESGQKNKKRKNAKKKGKAHLDVSKGNENSTSKNASALGSSKMQPNQHVRCEAANIPLTTITTILQGDSLERSSPATNPYQLPFQNCKYKSKVQVVDFFPDKLQDFATPYCKSDYEVLSDYESVNDEEASVSHARDNPDGVKWKWHFFIMVQDPIAKNSKGDAATMLLQVAGQDGDCLLDMEACNLRDQPQELAILKQRLFVLWGDLEEKKTENNKTGLELMDEHIPVSSRAFECLIKEYGVKAVTVDAEQHDTEWERMFGLFGTTVGK